jgi:hypothetical protein
MCRRLDPLGSRITRFERQIDGATADWTRSVRQTGAHREHLACREFDRAILEFDPQRAFQDEEGFVGAGVDVPVEGFRHDADANDVVVHTRQDLVGVWRIDQRRECVNVDWFRFHELSLTAF